MFHKVRWHIVKWYLKRCVGVGVVLQTMCLGCETHKKRATAAVGGFSYLRNPWLPSLYRFRSLVVYALVWRNPRLPPCVLRRSDACASGLWRCVYFIIRRGYVCVVKTGCGVGREVLCLQSHPACLACAKISKIIGSDQIRCLNFFVFGLMYKGV